MEANVYTFVGIRRHLFTDRLYKISVNEQFITMTDAENAKPKYILPIDLSTVIGFKASVQKGNRSFEGFLFLYKSKPKLMNAASKDLVRLMEVLSNKVTFSQIQTFYEPVKIIGRGASSSVNFSNTQVSILIDRFTNGEYAVKSIDKKYLNQNDKKKVLFETEVAILSKLANFNQQKHFAHLYSIFDCESSYYLVMDLMRGKSLHEIYKKLRKKSSNKVLFTPQQTKTIMNRLLRGLCILHEQKIIHRDLKPDNILLAQPNNFDTLSIVDFGLATYSDVSSYYYPQAGTKGFMAPEVEMYFQTRKLYDEKVDIYSSGVIFRWLVTGEIGESNMTFDPDIQDLMERMLDPRPKNRVSAKEALQHRYFRKATFTTLIQNHHQSHHQSFEQTPKMIADDQFNYEQSEDDTNIQINELYTMPGLKKHPGYIARNRDKRRSISQKLIQNQPSQYYLVQGKTSSETEQNLSMQQQ